MYLTIKYIPSHNFVTGTMEHVPPPLPPFAVNKVSDKVSP